MADSATSAAAQQFRLRTLFLAVTTCAVAFAAAFRWRMIGALWVPFAWTGRALTLVADSLERQGSEPGSMMARCLGQMVYVLSAIVALVFLGGIVPVEVPE